MKYESILEVKNLMLERHGEKILNDISFTVNKGECLAIIGSSGSGKSSLLKVLSENYFSNGSVIVSNVAGSSPRIVTIADQHHFKNRSNTFSFYYQQRFNSNDSEDAATVTESLLASETNGSLVEEKLALLGVSHLRQTPLVQLSNGEHKRVQIARALLERADWIFLDSPYTGLDVSARKLLNSILDKLVAQGIFILLVTSASDIPASVTHIAFLENGQLEPKMSRGDFDWEAGPEKKTSQVRRIIRQTITEIAPAYDHADFSVAVQMINTTVEYNNRKILNDINWRVEKGECWNVSGDNGSGKSTLLSLVTGDNPQAFANEIYLFDRKKGSGESIWDIKRKIGYVSPELHHYFDGGIPCFEVVASGLFDTIGLFKRLGDKQVMIVKEWMSAMQVAEFEKRAFRQLSHGQQRLTLLARALVKNPPLLILDEPCQGLDSDVSANFIALVDDICLHSNKTLIYVTHYQDEMPLCVTKTLRLEQGKIAA